MWSAFWLFFLECLGTGKKTEISVIKSRARLIVVSVNFVSFGSFSFVNDKLKGHGMCLLEAALAPCLVVTHTAGRK